MSDFIASASDAELLALAENFWTKANAAPASFGFTAAQVSVLDNKRNDFGADLSAHVTAQTDARSKRQIKDASRELLEAILRELTNLAKATSTVTTAQLSDLGIPTTPQAPTPTNATRPIAIVDTSQRLRHVIDFRDEAAPNIKRKPVSAVGAEIFVKIDGARPIDETECRFLTLDTQTPYLAEYDGANAGKMAHYLVRWRMKDNTASALSDTVSATITG